MSKSRLLKGLKPDRLRAAIQRRGAKGIVFHAVRRLGTMISKPLTGPSLIRLNPMGYVCNHACPMCWLQHLDQEELKRQKKADVQDGLKLDDYVRLLESMPPGLEEVNLVGGGEPLVHKQCVEIMRAIKQRGIRGSLISNGSLMKAETAAALVDMGWDAIRISVHGGDREVYQAIQGVDRFDIVRENLTTFNRLRHEKGRAKHCRLVVFHVLQHENIPQIEKLFQFATDVGADYMEMEKIIPYDSGKWLSATELDSARMQIEECAKRFAIRFNREAILGQLQAEKKSVESENRRWVPAKRCSVGFDQAFIDSMGNVLPCCFSDDNMGNLKEQSFSEIWASAKYQKFRVDLIEGRFRKYCISNRCHLPDVLHN